MRNMNMLWLYIELEYFFMYLAVKSKMSFSHIIICKENASILQLLSKAHNISTALSPWQISNDQKVRRISRLNRRAHKVSYFNMENVCNVNVGTLRGRNRDLVEIISRRRISI